ncbi:MAG: DUF5906 domain-containing protein [Pseudomonas sp.]
MNARPPMPKTLPPALQGFTAFNQWLNYRLTPQANGKLKKEAVGREGYRVDPTDPARWMSYEEAAATGLPLAFSFSESDPFFFLDIDNALTDSGDWSVLSRGLIGSLSGCAVEISSSGRGLHIFGVGAGGTSHSNRRDDLGLEFYTKGRFVALTGNMLTPDGSAFHSPPELPALVAEYFPPPTHSAATDWTDGPCDGWAGPTDDAELVRRASRHVSAHVAFTGGASFADLWNCNEDVLAEAFPPTNDRDPFNRSSADMALCVRLAWWTGKDCERIATLLRESSLARDKHDREDYLQRTVLMACGMVTDVLTDRPAAQLPVPKPPAAAALALASARLAAPELVESVGFLRAEQAISLFTGCVYVRDQHKVWVPSGELLKPDSFKAYFGGFQFLLDDIGKKTTDDAFKAFTNNPLLRCPQVSTVCFDPNLEPGAIVTNFKGRDSVNMWVPPVVRSVAGDAGPFLRHVAKLLPNERDQQILLSWMAACVQHIGRKFYWSPVLQGVQGNGKSFLSRVMQHAVSPEYSFTARSSDLGKDFNAWLEKALFVSVDDVRISDPEMYDRIKPLLTEKTQSIEGKGVDQSARRVFANFMFSMNDKRGLPKSQSERRFAVFFTAQQHKDDLARDGMDGDYMTELHDWANGEGEWAKHGENYGLAVITDYLRNYPINAEFNPARAGHRAPETSSSDEVHAVALGQREQEVQEAIDSGAIGFRGGWVSSHYALEQLRKTWKNVQQSNLLDVMGNLGYVRHPSLKDGRTNNLVQPDGARSILYVAKGRMDLLGLAGAEAARCYAEAQIAVV